MIRRLAPAAALLLLAAATFTHADDGAMTVKVSDLNLGSAAGARVALARARSAAENFCGDRDRRTLEVQHLVRACRADMTGKAVAAMHAPLVTALYRAPALFDLAGR